MVVPELRRVGAPACFIILVVLLGFHSKIPQQVDLQYVELFSGQGCISLAMAASGCKGSSHDIDLSKHMDLASTSGFLLLGGIQKKIFLQPSTSNVWTTSESAMKFGVFPFSFFCNPSKQIAMPNLWSTGYGTVVSPLSLVLAPLHNWKYWCPCLVYIRHWEAKRNKVHSHIKICFFQPCLDCPIHSPTYGYLPYTFQCLALDVAEVGNKWSETSWSWRLAVAGAVLQQLFKNVSWRTWCQISILQELFEFMEVYLWGWKLGITDKMLFYLKPRPETN